MRKQFCENFKGNRNDLIDGKNAKCSLAEIDVIHCLRNTVFFCVVVYGNTIIMHTYANNAEGGVFFFFAVETFFFRSQTILLK